MEKLGPTLTKNCEANFIDMSLVIFSHESLLEYDTILKKKLFQTIQCILQILLSSERFFLGHLVYKNYKFTPNMLLNIRR